MNNKILVNNPHKPANLRDILTPNHHKDNSSYIIQQQSVIEEDSFNLNNLI
jgi:hypothetical protein